MGCFRYFIFGFHRGGGAGPILSLLSSADTLPAPCRTRRGLDFPHKSAMTFFTLDSDPDYILNGDLYVALFSDNSPHRTHRCP